MTGAFLGFKVVAGARADGAISGTRLFDEFDLILYGELLSNGFGGRCGGTSFRGSG